MPDLGEMLIESAGGAVAMLVNTVASNPGPWLLIGLMMVGVLALSLLSNRRRRRR